MQAKDKIFIGKKKYLYLKPIFMTKNKNTIYSLMNTAFGRERVLFLDAKARVFLYGGDQPLSGIGRPVCNSK